MLEKGEFKLGMHPIDIYKKWKMKDFGQLLFTMVHEMFPSKARKVKQLWSVKKYLIALLRSKIPFSSHESTAVVSSSLIS